MKTKNRRSSDSSGERRFFAVLHESQLASMTDCLNAGKHAARSASECPRFEPGSLALFRVRAPSQREIVKRELLNMQEVLFLHVREDSG